MTEKKGKLIGKCSCGIKLVSDLKARKAITIPELFAQHRREQEGKS